MPRVAGLEQHPEPRTLSDRSLDRGALGDIDRSAAAAGAHVLHPAMADERIVHRRAECARDPHATEVFIATSVLGGGSVVAIQEQLRNAAQVALNGIDSAPTLGVELLDES
jgi:hypothetical protein